MMDSVNENGCEEHPLTPTTEEVKQLEAGHSLYPAWVRPDKVKKIQMLPIFPHIHDKILNAIPAPEIARFIQENGCMIDEEISTIVGTLAHYQATVPKAMIIARQKPSMVAKVYKKLTPMKEYLERADQILEWQWQELQGYKDLRDQVGQPLEKYSDEMDRFLKMLTTVQRNRKEAGVSDRQIEQMLGNDPDGIGIDLDRAYGREGLTEKMKDPISRARILGTIERLFDVVKSKAAKGEGFSFEDALPVDAIRIPEPEEQPMPIEEKAEIIEQIDLSNLKDVLVDPGG